MAKKLANVNAVTIVNALKKIIVGVIVMKKMKIVTVAQNAIATIAIAKKSNLLFLFYKRLCPLRASYWQR